ncbi:hypothetical protein [Streptomyces avermitilis]|uniref:hypothetical protein n=1 Tax=Streptomyces avermitilis TaxID=33903 RepID=UPI0033AC52BB
MTATYQSLAPVVRAGAPEQLRRPHCYCAACMGLGLRIGAFGPAVDEEGNTVPGSQAVYPWSALPAVIGGDVDRDERPYAWFTHFLEAAGHVVVDERDGENLWPRGIQHDDALFCETGVTGEFGPPRRRPRLLTHSLPRDQAALSSPPSTSRIAPAAAGSVRPGPATRLL